MKVNIQELRRKSVESVDPKPEAKPAPYGFGINSDSPHYLVSSEDLHGYFLIWGIHDLHLPNWNKPRIIELPSPFKSDKFNLTYNRVILERIGGGDDPTMIAWRLLLRSRELPQSI